jgi:adenylyltransferase/sulfurtransferase
MYPEPPDPGSVPSCAEGGVLGVIPGTIGTLQANETIKLILGFGRPAIGRLLTYSSADLEFRTYKLRRDPNCPVCGEHPTITRPIDYEQFCGVPIIDPKSLEETHREAHSAKQPVAATRPAPDPSLDSRGLPPGYRLKDDWEVTPRDVKALQDRGEKFLFIDCRLPNEFQITSIPGTTLLPLQQLGQRIGELTPHKDEKIIVHCKVGGRSMQFTQALRQSGFKDVRSMAGGILLWNKDINPGGPQY